MSVLTKADIESMASNPDVKLLGDNFEPENIEGCSYDLRVGTIIVDEYRKGTQKKKIVSAANENVKIVEVGPSQIVTILTLEEVNIPLNLCGTVFAMNSKSSSGFLILNPGHIDPGFKGPLSICAINLSGETNYLKIGDRIFTIIFEELKSKTVSYKKPHTLNRKDFEEEFFVKRASKLSPSIFNLITAENYIPFLKKQINEVLTKKVLNYLGIIATVAAIYGGIVLLKPSQNSKNETKSENELKEQTVINNRLKDSLNLLKFKNDSLKTVINGQTKK